jgi:putative tryptophan/tyrosine transport system substrate-binding protein
VLETISPELNAANFDALRRALRNLGYIEGQNLIIEYRSAEGQVDRFPELAIELEQIPVEFTYNLRA